MLFDAQSAGFDFTELSVSGLREVMRLFSSQSLQLAGLNVDLGAKGFGLGADVDRQIARLNRVMRTARDAGTPLVCVQAGPLPNPPATDVPPKPKVTPEEAGLILLPTTQAAEPPPTPPAPPSDPAMVSQVEGALVELGGRADRLGVMVAFRSELSSCAALAHVLKRVGCPWFGVDFDPAAAVHDEWNFDEILSRLGELIRHVRGRDAVAGQGGRSKPAVVGRGQVPWSALLADLDAAGYRGWLTLDPTDLPDRPAAARIGLKHLRSLRETRLGPR